MEVRSVAHLKVSCTINFRKKTACYLRKFDMTHLQVEQRKLQVKSAVASWALLYCECRFNITTTLIIFVVILELKSHF